MADECRDISGTQQLSIVIRSVHDQDIGVIDYSNVVKEYFLGFVRLEEFDAATLTLKIVQFLNKLNIRLQSCICLCFDGRHIDVNSSALKNEFIVIKSILMRKTINDVIQFLNELVPFSTAFPQTLRMIKSAITMPISQRGYGLRK
ncbi:unnamed protein product [Didymodactylos carnosus]|uniref:DUF4371 domain-containing protein n=1 Tax=Didymodactylos carnosus TaxID=1234261 RepID=A0A814MT02_9BILA|nr:unnamed protein product [Didymodactylos carnosus]CAF3848085.1 unnamed protein product [Didymodactylos carnosus]